jgi:hypothetical protein
VPDEVIPSEGSANSGQPTQIKTNSLIMLHNAFYSFSVLTLMSPMELGANGFHHSRRYRTKHPVQVVIYQDLQSDLGGNLIAIVGMQRSKRIAAMFARGIFLFCPWQNKNIHA